MKDEELRRYLLEKACEFRRLDLDHDGFMLEQAAKRILELADAPANGANGKSREQA